MKAMMLLCVALAGTAYGQPIAYSQYGKDSIPNIITAPGIASEIIFEDDEQIEYFTFGFDDAWDSRIVKDHILVFKPKDAEPETNLIVHTDKRHYLFTITVGNKEWTTHPNKSGAIYSLRMTYRDANSKAKRKKADEDKVLRNRQLATIDSYIYSNYDYRTTPNAQDILPLRAWDNGKITFLIFKPGMKRGVAYELNADGKASLVNQHTERDGVLVIHGIYPRLILRLGDQAVEIRRNEKFGQIENNPKTNIRNKVRTISEEAPAEFRAKPAAEKSTGETSIFPIALPPEEVPKEEVPNE